MAKLVHRTEPLPADAKGRDPWDATELDPSQSNALDSSLWEIASLENHFHHAIAALAKLFRDRLDKPEYPLDEFMDQTAEGVLQVELGRKPKGGVALAIMEENKGGLFPAEQWEGWAF